MLRRSVLMGLVAFLPALAACGGSKVSVLVLAGEEGAEKPEPNLAFEYLPFDRDSVFDALIAAAEDPEPQIPEDLKVQLDSIPVLQRALSEAEAEWAEARESLQSLSKRLQSLDRRSREYQQLYRRFDGMEASERRLNSARQAAFRRYTDLQQHTQGRSDSLRAVIEAWEEIAFDSYPDVEAQLLEATGQSIVYDTTNAEGVATLRMPGGRWYVHARVTLPSSELYWNVLIDPGLSDTLRLTRENAVIRPKF
jgi:hypothetical protein